MKSIQLALVVITISLLTACGETNHKNDTHTHGDGCSHTHVSKSNTQEQESFTVEADSALHHAHEGEALKESEHKPHKHGDGKVHTH